MSESQSHLENITALTDAELDKMLAFAARVQDEDRFPVLNTTQRRAATALLGLTSYGVAALWVVVVAVPLHVACWSSAQIKRCMRSTETNAESQKKQE